MGISLRTNVAALEANTSLSQTNERLNSNMMRLSSGQRINRAGDDAAGLAISEGFRANIVSLDQAKRNANDGVSLAQTADGAFGEVGNLLKRMRELAVQSRNGTNNTSQRGFLDDEFQQLKSEIDRIVSTTEFNGIQLIDGSQSTGIEFQVGAGTTADDRLTLSIATSSTSALGLSTAVISSTGGSDSAINALDLAIEGISTRRAAIGAMQNRLQVTMSNLDTYSTNLSAANSRIVDVDVASETAELTKHNILLQASTAMLAQANQAPQAALQLLGG